MEKEFFDVLEELIQQKKFRELKKILDEMNQVDVALFIEGLENTEAVIVFRMLSKEIAAGVFSYLTKEMQQTIVGAITDNEIAFIIEELFVDDAVDFLEEMPAGVVARVMECATPSTRKLINQFLNYPENSVGSIMTAEFVSLKKTLTVKRAIEHIRKTGLDKETIYTCYVTDSNRVLEGVISIKRLLLSADEEILEVYGYRYYLHNHHGRPGRCGPVDFKIRLIIGSRCRP
jgi:magnesium transporter